VSDLWGYDRGRPIDRYYIERFIAAHRTDIHGRVLEVKEPLYTERYGTGVARIDILDNDARNKRATLVADLSAADSIETDSFDCCVITQTLQYVYDVGAAARELHRMLRPSGVLLATVPAVTRIDPLVQYHDYWRFTVDSCTRLFADAFGDSRVEVQAQGNVLAAVAFLEGLAQEEFSPSELDVNDPLFPLVITIRAVKGEAP